jgi:hypothetical protein
LSVYSGAWWHYTMRCARRFLEDHDIEAYRTLIPGCSWSVFGHDYCFCLPVKVEAQEPREEFSDAMSNAAEADDA